MTAHTPGKNSFQKRSSCLPLHIPPQMPGEVRIPDFHWPGVSYACSTRRTLPSISASSCLRSVPPSAAIRFGVPEFQTEGPRNNDLYGTRLRIKKPGPIHTSAPEIPDPSPDPRYGQTIPSGSPDAGTDFGYRTGGYRISLEQNPTLLPKPHKAHGARNSP